MHARVGTNLILEQYVDGRELYVGIMGNARLQVLPVWELEMRKLRLDAPRIATRQVKWNTELQKRRGVKLGPARDLPPEVERLLVKTTKRLYRLLQLSGYARVDFRLDGEGRPYFLEANPNSRDWLRRGVRRSRRSCRHRLRTAARSHYRTRAPEAVALRANGHLLTFDRSAQRPLVPIADSRG